MTDQGAKWTDEEIAALEQRIRETYEEAVSDMTEKFNRFARKFKRDEKEMKARLARGEITAADYRDWLAGQIFQGKRWRQQLGDLAETLTRASQIAADIINDTTPGAFAYNANWAAFQIEKAGNASMGFELYDTQTVKRLLRDEPNLLPPSRVAIPEERRWNMQNITRQITQGVIQGEALDTIAKRLQRAATMDFNQARTHARTAMTGAQNAGRIETYHRAEDMGIKLRKEWLATLDSHTRHEHAVLDGQKRPVDEPFTVDGKKIMYPGDPSAAPELVYNCRCTLISDVDDWPAENAQRRDNENRVNIENMTFAEWAGWKKEVANAEKSAIIEKNKETAENALEHIGRIDVKKYAAVAGSIRSGTVVLTSKQREHIIERRGREFYDRFSPYFAKIIEDPDYIFKDKAHENTAIASKTIQDEDGINVNIVLRLAVETDESGLENSIITAIAENEKRYRQRIRNNKALYKKE